MESHDSPVVGHVGFFKTYYNSRKPFYWKGMYKDIQNYVAECDKCHETWYNPSATHSKLEVGGNLHGIY